MDDEQEFAVQPQATATTKMYKEGALRVGNDHTETSTLE